MKKIKTDKKSIVLTAIKVLKNCIKDTVPAGKLRETALVHITVAKNYAVSALKVTCTNEGF